jgi:hypothetical protein
VLSDLITNVGPELEPYCDEIMQLLIVNLGSNDVHRTIKPQVRFISLWFEGLGILLPLMSLSLPQCSLSDQAAWIYYTLCLSPGCCRSCKRLVTWRCA